MEEITQLKLTHKISQEMRQSRLNGLPNEHVNSHCKRDHLTPTPFDERKNVSTYGVGHNATKNMTNYNKPSMEKQFQQFRKNQDSYSKLPNLPAIQNNSQYHNVFQGYSQQKLAKGKQKQSWFLKMKWALDPKSTYQKNYGLKEGNLYNKQNKERIDHNHLGLLQIQQPQRHSNYQTQFHPYAIKKDAQFIIANKDHLANKCDIKNQTAISQYQRRYDSLMEGVKPKETITSMYRKEPIVRQAKLK